MLLGLHVSIAGSIDKAVDNAMKLNCTTFQIFTRNPRIWNYKKLEDNEIDLFIEKCKKFGYKKTVVHMPYLPNLSSPNDDIYNKSIINLKDEIERCILLRVLYLVTHLGSHLGKGDFFGLKRVIEAIDKVLDKLGDKIHILLENTAGTKNSIGYKFENLKYILDNFNNDERIGLCFDTAHAFAAGYDLRTYEDVNSSLSLLDNIIGNNRVKIIHLNDSKKPFNSHSDRHYHVGLGNIGKIGFEALLVHPLTKDIPLILETPVDDICDDFGNIKMVNTIIKNKNK